MIDLALTYVVDELNDYFFAVSPPAAGVDRKRVVAAALFDLDGKVSDNAKEKVVASVVNVQEDRVYHSVDVYKRRDDGTTEFVKPEIKVNVSVLFVANVTDYQQAMKMLSRVIAFFQHRTSVPFNAIDGLAGKKGHFTFEMHSMSLEQQNHLWGALGAKYMPSVMFKLGIVDIRDELVEAEIPPVLDVSANEPPAPGA